MFHTPDYLRPPLSTRIPQIANGMPRETVDYILKMNKSMRDYTARIANINLVSVQEKTALTERFTAEKAAMHTSHVNLYNSMMKSPVAQEFQVAAYKHDYNKKVIDFIRTKNAIVLKRIEDRASAMQAFFVETTPCVEAYYLHVAKARYHRKTQDKIDKAKRIEQRAARLQAMQDAPPFHDRPRKARNVENWLAMKLAGLPDHPGAYYDEMDLYELIQEVYGPKRDYLSDDSCASFDPSDCE